MLLLWKLNFEIKLRGPRVRLVPDMLFSCGDLATSQAQEKRRTGGGICKVLSFQKSLCRGELERALSQELELKVGMRCQHH